MADWSLKQINMLIMITYCLIWIKNINKLKLDRLYDIARYLGIIHSRGLVHCDLHGGNMRSWSLTISI